MDRVLSILSEHSTLAVALSVGSIAMFVGTILLVPWLVARAPADYFVRQTRPEGRGKLAAAIAKNAFGVLCVALGAVMIVLPGQGVLTILVGLSLIDFPGKRRLLRRLVEVPSVARTLAFLRRRARKPPFELP